MSTSGAQMIKKRVDNYLQVKKIQGISSSSSSSLCASSSETRKPQNKGDDPARLPLPGQRRTLHTYMVLSYYKLQRLIRSFNSVMAERSFFSRDHIRSRSFILVATTAGSAYAFYFHVRQISKRPTHSVSL